MNIFLSFLLSFFTLLFTLFGGWIGVDAPKDMQDDFVPVFRAVVASDTHVITLGDTGCRRISDMLRQVYALADADADYKALDAAVFVGDITDDGTATAMAAFTAVTNVALRDGTQRLGVAAQSHDCNTYGKKALDNFTQLTGQPTDFHEVINGYHFIGLSASHSDEQYTQEQVEWLDNELLAATSAAPEQPVFVFQHEHIADTVFGSYALDGWGVNYFNAVLNKYPQVIDVSGHSHYPANDPRSIWQGTFTAIGDGGLSYAEFTVDGVNAIHPAGYKNFAQSLIIEIDSENRVLVKVLDIIAGRILCTYLIDNVASPEKTKYSFDARSAVCSAPVFDSDAQIAVKKGLIDYTLTVPQATVSNENNEVYLYRLTVTDVEGTVLLTDWALSGYYFADRPEQISFKCKKVSGAHTASIIAEDIWGNQSEALTVAF